MASDRLECDGAEKKANISRALAIFAAFILMVPHLVAAVRWSLFGGVFGAAIFFRWRARKERRRSESDNM